MRVYSANSRCNMTRSTACVKKALLVTQSYSQHDAGQGERGQAQECSNRRTASAIRPLIPEGATAPASGASTHAMRTAFSAPAPENRCSVELLR